MYAQALMPWAMAAICGYLIATMSELCDMCAYSPVDCDLTRYFLISFLEGFLKGLLCVSAIIFLLETRRKIGHLKK